MKFQTADLLSGRSNKINSRESCDGGGIYKSLIVVPEFSASAYAFSLLCFFFSRLIVGSFPFHNLSLHLRNERASYEEMDEMRPSWWIGNGSDRLKDDNGQNHLQQIVISDFEVMGWFGVTLCTLSVLKYFYRMMA